MQLLTIKNESTVLAVEPIAPLTNPLGERPPSDAVSVGRASLLGVDAASTDSGRIGISENSQKNLVFMALIGFLIWKYGRKVLSA